MDPPRLESVENDLVTWGLIEREDGLRPTRRYQGALARAARDLAALERSEGPLAGNPVERVVAWALRDVKLPAGAQLRRDHERFLVAMQLASLPEGVRRAIGL